MGDRKDILWQIQTACDLLEAELWGFRMLMTEHLRRLREETHGITDNTVPYKRHIQ